MSIITEGEYKGRAVLTIKYGNNDRFPFTFGITKARLMLENVEAIRAFYDKHKNDPKPARKDESFS